MGSNVSCINKTWKEKSRTYLFQKWSECDPKIDLTRHPKSSIARTPKSIFINHRIHRRTEAYILDDALLKHVRVALIIVVLIVFSNRPSLPSQCCLLASQFCIRHARNLNCGRRHDVWSISQLDAQLHCVGILESYKQPKNLWLYIPYSTASERLQTIIHKKQASRWHGITLEFSKGEFECLLVVERSCKGYRYGRVYKTSRGIACDGITVAKQHNKSPWVDVLHSYRQCHWGKHWKH